MRKINVEELKGLNYEDGEKLLLANGYKQTQQAIDDEVNECDYIVDTYFTLYDEDEHTISFIQYMNKNEEPANDDGSSDFVVREYWDEV